MSDKTLPSEFHYAAQGSGKLPRVSMLAKQYSSNTAGAPELIRTAAATTTSYVATASIDVSLCSQVCVLVKLTNTASGDIVSMIPEVCVEKNGDGFYALSDYGAASVVTLGADPSDNSQYNTHKWSSHTVRPMEIKSDSITTTADVVSFVMVFDVSFANSFRMSVRADAGTPTLELSVARKS